MFIVVISLAFFFCTNVARGMPMDGHPILTRGPLPVSYEPRGPLLSRADANPFVINATQNPDAKQHFLRKSAQIAQEYNVQYGKRRAGQMCNVSIEWFGCVDNEPALCLASNASMDPLNADIGHIFTFDNVTQQPENQGYWSPLAGGCDVGSVCLAEPRSTSNSNGLGSAAVVVGCQKQENAWLDFIAAGVSGGPYGNATATPTQVSLMLKSVTQASVTASACSVSVTTTTVFATVTATVSAAMTSDGDFGNGTAGAGVGNPGVSSPTLAVGTTIITTATTSLATITSVYPIESNS